MSEIRCKRCNRILRNKLSIEHGYGDKYYRIIQLNKKPEVKPEFSQELAFIKCEVATLKRMFRNIQINGANIDPINRIKPDEQRPERDANKGNMANVITEMKTIFSRIENVYDILKPINSPIEILV